MEDGSCLGNGRVLPVVGRGTQPAAATTVEAVQPLALHLEQI